MSLEEDLLMRKVTKLEERVDALEAIVTYPKGKVVEVPEDASVTGTPYDGLKLSELQDELRDRGLPTSGNKSELVDRLLDDDTAPE
jgi:hypothetical protein